MKNKILIIMLLTILQTISLQAGKELILPVVNSGDSCQFGPKLILLDNNNDNIFDELLYTGCPLKAKLFYLIVQTNNIPSDDETAIVISGNIFSNNFLIYLYAPTTSTYTHRINYDSQSGNAILEDYSGNDNNQTINNEEADEYFYSRIIDGLLLISKKKDIDVLSVMLCNIEGIILYNYSQTSGWSEFTFDLSAQPSGMYLVRFVASDKAITKRVIYIR